MIAIDTSSLLAFLAGESGKDVEYVDVALQQGTVVLPGVVVAELFSAPNISTGLISIIRQIPLLEPSPGFWERCGKLRSKVLARKFKSKLADALIAQNCIDNEVALVTRDGDFRHYVTHGLTLI